MIDDEHHEAHGAMIHRGKVEARQEYTDQIITNCDKNKEFVTGDDGYVYYWPTRNGAYNSRILRILADELDRRNAEWDKHLQESFDNDTF